jgi:RHS repeat-associated protein
MDEKERVALVRVGPAHPDDRGPAVQFHLSDHLGSSNVVVDSSGGFVNREEFTPYGETSFGTFAKKRYRFTGKERDEESGCTYHGARYYSAHLARWLSCDPKPPHGGGTLYSYVSGRPIVLYDPTGEEEKNKPTAQPTGEHWVAASPTGPSVILDDPFEDPTNPNPVRRAFEVFNFGGRSVKADHRYATLGEGQSIMKRMLDRGHGCAACHISTAVHNKYGKAGLNPENNLPWDWALDEQGYNDWVAFSGISRAVTELGVNTATVGLELHASLKGFGKRTPGTPLRDVTGQAAPRGWSEQSLPKDGRLWAPEGTTTGGDLVKMVNETKRPNQRVTVLTGTHGDKRGRIGLSGEYNSATGTWKGNAGDFLREDIKAISRNGHAQNVRVLDVTRMSERELQAVLSEGGDIYAAWCHGDSTGALKRAVNKVKGH